MFNSSSRLLIVFSVSLLASLTVSAQQSASDEKPDDRKTGTITGRVVSDTGQPLANAGVTVTAVNSTQSRSATTASDGTFTVRALDPLLFTIYASLPSYVPKPRDPDSYYRTGDHVNLELVKGGVITGTVTTPNAEPVIGVRVRAYLLRAGGRMSEISAERPTDDRGVYRIYGLRAGNYVVAAGGMSSISFGSSYDSEGQVFAPSSSRETAAEFSVRSGEETTNVDIRFKPESAHEVSGVVKALSGVIPKEITSIRMTSTSDMPEISTYQLAGGKGFTFAAIPDGTYFIVAQSRPQNSRELSVSDPYRVVVKGADVTGIELALKPLGSISGRLLLEPSKAPQCQGKRRPILSETLLVPLMKTDKAKKDDSGLETRVLAPTVPDSEGAFLFPNVYPNQYGFDVRQFAKYWYLQSITTPVPTRSNDVARNWLTLKSGERVTGVTITLAEGAASLKGSIKTSEAETTPKGLYLHLVPAERERADDVLRFFVAPVNEDRTFAVMNLPPGRYFALVVRSNEKQSESISKLKQPDSVELRAKLRRDAEASKLELEFKPCENIEGYQLPFKPTH